ncbi:MAG TPA: preprotein translocase subunit YajC [Candidatus Scatomorpha pullicola]|nr:preprotein translocase subunit YajC [Candidatus Scatomorpha pullicola]
MFHNILTGTSAAGGMSSILFLVIIFVVFYFFLIRPENKRKKKLTEMRNNISLGDEIVTIGGIMGKVVQVTEDTVTFETGEDRVRLQVTKWAISSNVREEKERAAQEAAARAAKSKKKAKTSGEENSVDEAPKD